MKQIKQMMRTKQLKQLMIALALCGGLSGFADANTRSFAAPGLDQGGIKAKICVSWRNEVCIKWEIG